MMIKKLKLLMLVSSVAFTGASYALEQLNEEELSNTTGQDGLTVQVVPAASGVQGRLGIQNIVYRDRDGFTGTDVTQAVGSQAVDRTGSGSVWVNMKTGAGNGVQFCTTVSASCTQSTLSSKGIKLLVDADGGDAGGTAPRLNVGLAMQSDVQGIKLDIDNIGLRGGAAVATTPNASTLASLRDATPTLYKMVSFSDGVNIDYAMSGGGSPISPTINMVLGSASASPGLVLTSMNIATVDFGTVSILDSSNNANALTAKVAMSNVDLSGSRVDITQGGVVWSYAGQLGASNGGMNVNLNDIGIGTLGVTNDATIFNGLDNGSLGSMGISGIKLTNPSVIIKGM